MTHLLSDNTKPKHRDCLSIVDRYWTPMEVHYPSIPDLCLVRLTATTRRGVRVSMPDRGQFHLVKSNSTSNLSIPIPNVSIPIPFLSTTFYSDYLPQWPSIPIPELNWPHVWSVLTQTYGWLTVRCHVVVSLSDIDPKTYTSRNDGRGLYTFPRSNLVGCYCGSSDIISDPVQPDHNWSRRDD